MESRIGFFECIATSFDQSQALKKCGYPQEAFYFWTDFDNTSCVDTPSTYKTLRFQELITAEELEDYEERSNLKIHGTFAAPTCEEILWSIANEMFWSPAKVLEAFIIWSKEKGNLSVWIEYSPCAVMANSAAEFYRHMKKSITDF